MGTAYRIRSNFVPARTRFIIIVFFLVVFLSFYKQNNWICALVHWCQLSDHSYFMCRASAIFVGVYEPTKQKLLKMFPENISAVAHFVRELCMFPSSML